MALVLTFGLSLAVGRYESRRADVVTEANTVSTAYLRAQNLAEPSRTRSLDLLRKFTDSAVRIAETVPGSPEHAEAIAGSGQTQRALWVEYSQALAAEPTGTPARLYVDSLNAAGADGGYAW